MELDKGKLGIERKLYYREMIARFSHHNAIQWNISEEYDISPLPLQPEQIKEFAWYVKAIDPYNHPITVHNCDSDGDGHVFAKNGEAYAIYLPDGSLTGTLNLTNEAGNFSLSWYNPRTGWFEGEIKKVAGGKDIRLGNPPSTPTEDWVVLIQVLDEHY